MSLRSERVEDSSEFNSNVSRTDDGDTFGLFFNIKESIRVDTVRSTWNLLIAWNGRSPSDGNGDLFSFDLVLFPIETFDLEGILVNERSVSFMVIDLVIDEVLLATF